MSNIILEDEQGNRRIVPPGRVKRLPGERVVGPEKNGADLNQLAKERKEQFGKFVLLANLFGMKASDFITFAAKVFGVKPCAFCEMRKLILHRMGEIGVRKAMWMLLMTFKEQFKERLTISTIKKIILAARELLGGKSNGASPNR